MSPATSEIYSENEIDEEDENVSENDKEDETDEFCRNLIDEIRREQFGIGESFGEREAKLIQIHHDRLGRSLDRLLKELYTKDTHFVLELIQNADDNTYPDEMFTDDSDDRPTVAFIIKEDKVVVLNNETGFEERNIKAICDVGKSTKGEHRKGYIGHRGIGFKSVFRVTDSPEVHSNGFHIRFDASQGSIGCILPEWCESEDNSVDLVEGILQTDDLKQDWTTQIVLPLKQKVLESSSDLSARFHGIHPSLLLFLNRLKCIAIDDKVNEKQLIMRKRQLKNNTVELSLNGRPSLWYVISKEIDINVRPDVSSTELSLAFQMDDAAQISLKPKPLPVQSVFAFLSLRSYGFKFLIQADFEVPPSRKDIDRDSSWNQWILERIPDLVVEAFYSFKADFEVPPSRKNIDRDSSWNQWILERIPDLVVEAFYSFKDLSTFPPILAASIFFQFLPSEKEIHGVFKPIARKIIKLLQAESCIPVQDFNTPEDENDPLHLLSECTWMMPSSVVLSDHAISEVIPPSLLEKHLNLHYVHRGMQSAVNADLLCALGVKRITLDNLLDICKAQIKLAVRHRDEGRIEEYETCIAWFGEWLYGVARHLEQNHNCSKETLNKIASAAIFPLSDGSVVSLHGNLIFFSVNIASASQRQQASRYTALQEDSSTLHWHIFDNLDDIARLRVKQLLADLGVKEMTPKDAVRNRILPFFRSDFWKGKLRNASETRESLKIKSLRCSSSTSGQTKIDQQAIATGVQETQMINPTQEIQGIAHMRRPLQTDGKYHLQHLVIWLLIHLTLSVAVLMLVRSQSSPYQRLHILIKKYCNERLTQDLLDTHLYSSLCNSFQLNPPTNNQPFQEFIHSGTTARFYFKSEVILVLKKDAVNVKVEITPISGSLAEKKGWHSAGPSVDIVVSGGNSKIELVGLPHMLSQQAPKNEIKIFHQHTEKEPIDQFDVHRLLKFHLFYKPGLRLSPSEPGTNNTRNILPLTTIDLPVFRKEGQPEKVQIAPIPQNEAAFHKVLNWLKQDGFELESSDSPCTYPEHNDSFGFWKKRFALLNDYKQLIAKPTRNILILDPVDSLNRSRIHLRQLNLPYDGECFYLSLLHQNTETTICDTIEVKSSSSLSAWESSMMVRFQITVVMSVFCFVTGLCLEGLLCDYYIKCCGSKCLAKYIFCSLLLAVLPCCVLLKCGDYPQGKINIVISGSISFFSGVMFVMVAFLIWYHQLFHFSKPALVYLSTVSLWKLLLLMVAGFYVMYGFGIVSEHRLNKLRDATDALLKWYYFPYYFWPLIVLLLVTVFIIFFSYLIFSYLWPR